MAKNNITIDSTFFNNFYDFYAYYNKCTQSIEFYEEHEIPENDDNFILTPFTYEVEWYAREFFHEILTEDERDLVDNYPRKKGFFNFLRDIDLIETYYYAKEKAELLVAKNWAEENNLSINWEI